MSDGSGTFTVESLAALAEKCGPTHYDACPCVHRGYLLLVKAARQQRDALLAELRAALDLAELWRARAETAEADQQREIENNIALAAERDSVAARNEALEKRIAEGVEAWGVYRDGRLERAETKITHCHAMDVRRVVVLDEEE